ncbi:MAG: hypothetical protein ACTSQE_14185 [Candidatus Heimdallarchaeaceae archaeon]
MPDGLEVDNNLNRLTDDSSEDANSDGLNDDLNNVDKYNSNTGSNNSDTDGNDMQFKIILKLKKNYK